MERFDNIRNQYLVTAALYAIAFSHGQGLSWFSSNILPSQLSTSYRQADQLDSERMYALGQVVGNIFFLIMGRVLGMRIAIYMLLIPETIYWIILTMDEQQIEYKMAKFFSGMVSAGLMDTVPMYVSEFADRRHRGTLVIMCYVLQRIGTLFNLLLGELTRMPSRSVCFAFVWLNPCIMFVWYNSYETPLHHLRRRNWSAAEESYVFFNFGNRSELTASEVLVMHEALREQMCALRVTKVRHTWRVFRSWTNLRMLTICLVLSWLMAYSGYFVMQTSPNFGFAHIVGVPKKSHIYIVVCVELCGSIAGMLLIDRIGRLPLFLMSSAGGLASAVTMGVFTWRHHNDIIVYNESVLMFTCVIVFLFSLTAGLASSTMVNIADQFDLQVHHYTASVISTPQGYFKYSAMMMFFVVRYYYGISWSFLISAVSILGAMLVMLFLLPEKNGADLFARNRNREKCLARQ